MTRFAFGKFLVAGISAILPCSVGTGQEISLKDSWNELLAVYATQPQGYPVSKEYARPDTRTPFRWHFYHDEAIRPFADAQMTSHTDPYNPLEGEGVSVERGSKVTFRFSGEHVTEGKQSLRATFPAADEKGVVRIQGMAGPMISNYSKTLACMYWPHYRWLKLDVYNPAKEEVRVRVAGVPFVLHSGKNVVAVKTADVGRSRLIPSQIAKDVIVEAGGGASALELYLDNFRMEQELPAAFAGRGRMFHFPGRADAKSASLAAPGFTAIEPDTVYTRDRGHGWTDPDKVETFTATFRSDEHGLLWGGAHAASPFRVDLPNGRYGVYVFASPLNLQTGAKIRLNGQEQELLAAHSAKATRAIALGGEAWDYRPGSCAWEQLVRGPHYPATNVLEVEVKEGRLLVEGLRGLRALMIFPADAEDEALKELGRLNYLLAESWDVSHPWVKGDHAQQTHYIGFHDEAARPEIVVERLKALRLGDADFQRGFVLFQRGLTDAVYQDTIPAPEEAAFKEMRCFAAAGQRECATLGILPLRLSKDLTVRVSDLKAANGSISAKNIDVRFARLQQKTVQYGHHNWDFNYQEGYLVQRPRVDLHPGAARRVYFDIAVPADAPAGQYTGQATVQDADGKTLASVPLVVDVLPLKLAEPRVTFASTFPHPRLKEYGFNAFATSYDDAVANGYPAYLIWPYDAAPPAFKGKRIGWAGMTKNKDLLNPLLADGLLGKGPRGFFGGYLAGSYGKQAAERTALEKPFFDALLKELPEISIFNVTIPSYGSPWGTDAHEIHQVFGIPEAGTADNLTAARQTGKEFWFVDGQRHSKEQAARFTMGFWLWRLGATGRCTTLSSEAYPPYYVQTARAHYAWVPYFTQVGGSCCNAGWGMMESLTEGDANPSRDVILCRQGIDDYRYIDTLDLLVQQADAKKLAGAAVTAARRFRDELWTSLALDLTQYYEGRGLRGPLKLSYTELWHPKSDNPWTAAKFNDVRRAAAQHIVAVMQTLGD